MKGGKMTSKDFKKLADSLGIFQHYLFLNDDDITDEFQNLVDSIKHICKSANPRFDAEVFDQAIYLAFHNGSTPKS